MNRVKLLAGSLILVFVICFAWVGLASAHSFHTGTSVVLGSGQPIRQTVFAAGRTVNIDNEVFGDVFCAGQTVTISGTVHGDIICAGQTVQVSGTVDGDVRLAGQTVTLSASVAGNATIGSQTFTLEPTARVGGDMSVGSSDATLHGMVGRDLAIASDSTVISGSVGRDIKGAATQLSLADNAHVGGNIDFTSKNGLAKSAGAVVAGKVTHNYPKQAAKPKHGAVWGFGFLWFLYWLAAMLIIAMAIVLLFPRLLHNVTDKAMPRPWKALLVGFVANAVLPLGLFILAITVVGIPLALLVMLLWFVMAVLSGPFFAYYVGRWVLRRSRQPLLIMLVGTAAVVIACFVPIIGVIVSLASFFIGSGMLLLEVFQRTPKPQYRVTPVASK
jgi:cytoskeletal protein CcmA (bactofilin family)